MKRYGKHGRSRPDDLITASAISSYAFCPEAWRLQYGLGLPADNQDARAAGTRHHEAKAAAERIAGGALTLGRLLVVLAVAALLVFWVLSR
jgi:hypothetical protein